MTRDVSLGAKVKQIAGLLGTKDLNDWEQNFVRAVYARTHEGASTLTLTDKQIEIIDRIWDKHFA